jgi:DNA-binding transcriptional ArsR family regulator
VAGELAAHEPLVRVDVAARGRALIGGGVEALFASLHPMLRWHNPVLVVENGTDLDLRPNGRGITLVPSVFASRPWVGTDPAAAFIAYPVRRSMPGPEPRPQLAGDPLVALLGRSRAAVLRAAGNGATTTDLARRAGISAPSASQHASVLRDAGLLATTRRGKAAHHSLTVLATVLLAA